MLSDGSSASAEALSAGGGGAAESAAASVGAGWVPSAPAVGASSAMVVWRARERSVACGERRERCELWVGET
jgi:hypothetical protein